MTRIIAGRARGHRLETPRGAATRPTSDRVREALFSALESTFGSLDGLRFLDLYAGSGAVGLEAWSRGAAAVTLVESDRRTADLVTRNARSIGCRVAEVVGAKISTALTTTPESPYDIVFLDPPYPLSDGDVSDDLAQLAAQGWLAGDAVLVVERGSRSPEPSWPPGVRILPGKRGRKKYGETTLWLGEYADPEDDALP